MCWHDAWDDVRTPCANYKLNIIAMVDAANEIRRPRMRPNWGTNFASHFFFIVTNSSVCWVFFFSLINWIILHICYCLNEWIVMGACTIEQCKNSVCLTIVFRNFVAGTQFESNMKCTIRCFVQFVRTHLKKSRVLVLWCFVYCHRKSKIYGWRVNNGDRCVCYVVINRMYLNMKKYKNETRIESKFVSNIFVSSCVSFFSVSWHTKNVSIWRSWGR